MIGWLAKRSRPFVRDRRGAVAIEYALLLPVLLLFSFGILEVSLCMASLATLEGGLKQASRFGITSQTPDDNVFTDNGGALAAQVPTAFAGRDNRTKMIMAILNVNTLNLIDLNTADLKTQTFDSFSQIQTGEPFTDANNNGTWDPGESFSDTNCNKTRDGPGAKSGGSGAAADAGASGAIVVYTVTYNWRVITPIVGKFLGIPDPSRPGRYMIPMMARMVVKNEPNISGSSFCK
ncbi:MAG: TadE/TadG family type IV pilus assembly protein [Dongia sp.]